MLIVSLVIPSHYLKG